MLNVNFLCAASYQNRARIQATNMHGERSNLAQEQRKKNQKNGKNQKKGKKQKQNRFQNLKIGF